MDRRTLLTAALSAAAAAPLAGLAGCAARPSPEPDGPGADTTADPTTGADVPAPERLAYGEHPSQFGELHRPAGPSRGVVVVIHGGFWRDAYDLSLGTPLAEELAGLGWTAWNLEYRRVGDDGGVPATLDDVAAGIDRLDRVDGLDVSRVVTLGHSAGGHLAAWAAGRRDAAVPVTHVISQAGVLDLRLAGQQGLGGGAVDAFLDAPAATADASVDPSQQVPVAAPVWCVHGTSDDIVPPAQSEAYVAAARGAGGEAQLVAVDGDHFTLIDTGSEAWRRTLGILDGISPTPG